MSTLVPYNFDPIAEKKRVRYEGSDTIYEGMAVCYNSDTTTNWLDWSGTAESSTTAEGSQNEGKYRYVEAPSSDNLRAFAGVVCAGSWVGSSGPAYVDIYVPNGAVVPVRSSINNVESETVLCVQAGDYEFQTNTYANGSESIPVALAMEDIDRSSTEGLCLAQLHGVGWMPVAVGFSSGERAAFGAGVSSGTVEGLPRVFVDSTQTGGTFTAWRLRAELNGAGGALGGLSGTWRFETVVGASCSSQGGSYQMGLGSHLIFKSGATASAAQWAAIIAKVENQDGTPADLTSSGILAPLRLETQISSTTPPPANTHWMIHAVTQGADTPDGFMIADSLTALGAYASTGDAPALATGDIMIPVRIAGTTYYLVALVDSGT